MTRVAATTIVTFASAAMIACSTQPIVPSSMHIKDTPRPTGAIPDAVQQSTAISPPKPAARTETYSVAVYKVPVQSLLFALARDAKINVDVHPGIEGEVTLNALNQTLQQLLSRISKQVDMRYEFDGPNLIVRPDSPFLKNYKIDYVNMSRESVAKVNIATEVSSARGVGTAGAGSGDNNSTTSILNTSNNRFWQTLVENVKDLLRETDKVIPDANTEGASPASTPAAAQPAVPQRATTAQQAAAPAQGAAAASQPASANGTTPAPRATYREAASVIANMETGLLSVRATSRQHDKIQEFLDQVMSSARRQVLIEATIVEVQLGDNYQQGINWASLRTSETTGPSLTQGQTGGSGGTALPSGVTVGTSPGIFTFNYVHPNTILGSLSATIQLLESFGKVKVLSSPKISVLNNQTALLKVVDNKVYFTIRADTTSTQGVISTTYNSELHTVPIGFVMSVTPQIADSDEVVISVRPTVSRIIGFVRDPNPALANAQVPVVSEVPVVQTREMESVLKVPSGQTAVMGGLMQDSVNNLKDAVPGVGRLAGIGDLFSYRNETNSKTELVIFLRPIVVKRASLDGDYKDFRTLLPTDRPLNEPPYEVRPIESNPASGSQS